MTSVSSTIATLPPPVDPTPPDIETRITEVVDAIAGQSGPLAIESACRGLLGAVEATIADCRAEALLTRIIAGIDRRIGGVVDAILHHHAFRALEAAWRSLWHVVERVDFRENIRIHVWNCSKEELRDDLTSVSDPSDSRLFGVVHTAEYGQFGGEPYAALFIDFSVNAEADVGMIRRMAAVAAMAHAPVFLSPTPSFLGLSSFRDLQYVSDPAAAFSSHTLTHWVAFRAEEDSRYVGLVLPRMLLRLPHEAIRASSATFIYDERIEAPDDLLWGNSVYAFAVRLADAFARYRTTVGLLGTFDDPPPVVDTFPTLGSEHFKPPVEILLSSRLERELEALGFIPLTCHAQDRPMLRFSSAASVQAPKRFGADEGGREATLNYLLGTRLSHLMLACRFIHYLKVIQRESIGGARTREEIEHDLNIWLERYVRNAERLSPAERRKFPLRAARVATSAIEGMAEWYRLDVLLQPHLRYRDEEFVLSVAGRVPR